VKDLAGFAERERNSRGMHLFSCAYCLAALVLVVPALLA
jgi:hypothetical protein